MKTKYYNHFFIDRDGVINENAFVNTPDDFEFIEGSLTAFYELKLSGCSAYIITNQGGIEAGYLTEGDLMDIHSKMLKFVNDMDGKIDGIFYCPHLKTPCECRKPKPGLIDRAIKLHSLSLRKNDCCLIGDYITDWQAAEAAGIQPIAVQTGRYSEPEAEAYVKIHDIPFYPNLLAAVEALADPIPF